MMSRSLFFLSLTLLFHFHFSTILAQSPAASPATPPAAPPKPTRPPKAVPPVPTSPPTIVPPTTSSPPDITKILKKAGHFRFFLRLLKSTNVGETINSQLSNTDNGLTVFAPTDYAFSNLGNLNSLSDEKQIQLVQFHILPIVLSTTELQTISNPLRTQAGVTDPGQFPLNVTTTGSQMSLSTGIMNTSISDTIYTDNKLAVYQVDSVLLPSNIFGSMPKKTPATAAQSPTSSDDGDASASTSASSAVSLTMHGMVVTIRAIVVASFLL